MLTTAAASDIVVVFIAAINFVATGLRPVYSESEPQAGGYSGCFFGEK
jgi:hypothetical protein